jgi:drug/metabolite transporter (DMT)-like permease
MTNVQRIPAKLAAGLLFAIILDTALQLTWKTAVAGLPEQLSLEALLAVITSPLFLALCAMMLCQLGNWINVLGHADLSFAQPVTSLSYISALLLSAFYLGESIGPIQVAGVAFILIGVWFISQTDHSSSGGAR